jgi:hypothetical protein
VEFTSRFSSPAYTFVSKVRYKVEILLLVDWVNGRKEVASHFRATKLADEWKDLISEKAVEGLVSSSFAFRVEMTGVATLFSQSQQTAGFANPYLSVVFLPRSPGIAFDVSMNDEPQLGFSYI